MSEIGKEYIAGHDLSDGREAAERVINRAFENCTDYRGLEFSKITFSSGGGSVQLWGSAHVIGEDLDGLEAVD